MTTAAEIRELWGTGTTQDALHDRPADPDRQRLLDAMSSRVPTPMQELVKRSGLVPERVNALLGLLGLEDGVRREEGGWRKVRTAERRG